MNNNNYKIIISCPLQQEAEAFISTYELVKEHRAAFVCVTVTLVF